jgi:hemin uptake protein HemP
LVRQVISAHLPDPRLFDRCAAMNEPASPSTDLPAAALPAPIAPGPATPGASRESWRSEELLGARTEVLILHGSEVYRLRRTRQGKLILYK